MHPSDLILYALGRKYWVVTQDGRVYDRRSGRELSTRVSLKTGYCIVGILDPDGRSASAFKQSVVWTAFHGRIPDGWAVYHLDGNTRNNALKNLTCLPVGESPHQALGAEGVTRGAHLGPVADLEAEVARLNAELEERKKEQG